ncbi:hypothetical protein GCM10029964_043770 [Kibdelosporangium lantanae]
MVDTDLDADPPDPVRVQLDDLPGSPLPTSGDPTRPDQAAGGQFGDEGGDGRLAQPGEHRELRAREATLLTQDTDDPREVGPSQRGAIGRLLRHSCSTSLGN